MSQPPASSMTSRPVASTDPRAREVSRITYLQAMGVQTYLSRTQLAGAASSRRLVLVSPAPETAGGLQHPPAESGSAAPAPEANAAAALLDVTRRPSSAPPQAPEPQVAAASQAAGEVERFSLVTVQMGDWLWLEETTPGDPGDAYWQLAGAIAVALFGKDCPLERGRFDWPLHRSAQLDAGPGAAGAALQAFLQRRVEQRPCAGLVLSGAAAQQRLATCELPQSSRLNTVAIADMLVDPTLKRTAWRDLQELRRRP